MNSAEERDRIEQELGLAAGFTSGLFEEDDWSFVIKASALIETTVNQVIGEHLHHDGVMERIARLPLPQRLQILEAYAPDSLNRGELRAVAAISELRNRLAHNVRHTGFTFATFLGDLAKRAKFYDDVRAAANANERKSLDAEFGGMGDGAFKVATWLGVYTVAMKLVSTLQARRDVKPNYKGALIAALMRGEEAEP